MAVPLFHITALSPIALASIPVGGKIVMMRKWDAGTALQMIKNERVTRFTGGCSQGYWGAARANGVQPGLMATGVQPVLMACSQG